MQADGRDGRLQLVRDGVQERILLFVAPDLSNKKSRIEEDSKDEDEKE